MPVLNPAGGRQQVAGAAGATPQTDAATNDLSLQMRAVSAEMSRLKRLPDVNAGPPPVPAPSLGVRFLIFFTLCPKLTSSASARNRNSLSR